jgi:hypothetical protein
MDLQCISFSSTLSSPSFSYYAYPYHPFVWSLSSVKSSEREKKEMIQTKMENRILFHNQCTNNIKKGIPSCASRFFEKDIETFFNHNMDLFKSFCFYENKIPS